MARTASLYICVDILSPNHTYIHTYIHMHTKLTSRRASGGVDVQIFSQFDPKERPDNRYRLAAW